MGISLIQPWEWAVLARCGASTEDLALLSASNVASFKKAYGAMVWDGLAGVQEIEIVELMPAFRTVDLIEASLVAAVIAYNVDVEVGDWGYTPELREAGKRVAGAVGGRLLKAMLGEEQSGFVAENRYATPKGTFESIRWRA